MVCFYQEYLFLVNFDARKQTIMTTGILQILKDF